MTWPAAFRRWLTFYDWVCENQDVLEILGLMRGCTLCLQDGWRAWKSAKTGGGTTNPPLD